jgi:hypothetical protein
MTNKRIWQLPLLVALVFVRQALDAQETSVILQRLQFHFSGSPGIPSGALFSSARDSRMQEVDWLLQTQHSFGSWPDLSYDSDPLVGWDVVTHYTRVREMARLHFIGSGTGQFRDSVRLGIEKRLQRRSERIYSARHRSATGFTGGSPFRGKS